MRKITYMMLLLGLMVVGCDSDSDGGDSDTFVGTWTVVGISDANGDRMPSFEQGYESIAITFGADSQVTMDVDAILDAADVVYSGSYQSSEGSESLSVTLTTGQGPQTLSFTYEFETATRIALTSSSTTTTLLSVLLQTSLAHPVKITLIKS